MIMRILPRAVPAIFVVLWSTGFVVTKYVVNNADPLTYLAIRMALVVLLMAVIVAIARPRSSSASGHGCSSTMWCTGPRSSRWR